MPAESTKDILQQKLTESINEVTTWASAGKDFVAEQAPLVIQEMIRWAIAQDAFFMCLSFLLIAANFALWYRLHKWYMSINDWNYNPAPVFSILGHLIWCAAWTGTFCVSAYHLVYVWCAPRLFIIEKVAELAGKFNGR